MSFGVETLGTELGVLYSRILDNAAGQEMRG